MRRIFVDTSAWDAIADAGDPNHELALAFSDEIVGQCRLVVTNYILDELYTFTTLLGLTGLVALSGDAVEDTEKSLLPPG